MEDLHDHQILVTGASGALGEAVVTALVASGARVVAAARRRTRLDALAAELRHHDHLRVVEADVTIGHEVERLYDAVERDSALTGVVHCVGTFAMGPLAELGDETVDSLVRTNLLAAVLVLRGALRRMAPRSRGRVVVVGGIASEGPAPGAALYGATKSAVAHLVRSAAAEVHANGVTVNAVLPGVMDTADNRAAMPGADASRWVPTAAVARAVTALLGPSGDGITGTYVRLPDRTA